MRYVIAVCFLTGFLIWDGFENDGRYLDIAVKQTKNVLNQFGAGI